MINIQSAQKQNHYFARSVWRRGIGCKSGSELPETAKQPALSLPIKVMRPSFSNADLSSMPLSFAVLAYKASSILSVIRMTSICWYQRRRHNSALFDSFQRVGGGSLNAVLVITKLNEGESPSYQLPVRQ